MGMQAARDHVLLLNDQPKTLPPLVAALKARGYQVSVVLTFGDSLTWLEVETPRCLIVYRPARSASETALVRAHRLWAKQEPLMVVTSVPAPLRYALAEGKLSVVPPLVPPDVLCQMVVTLTSQEETL